ncbi:MULTISPECIES: HpcH/HpaI aldolase/citrate lyase family protein [Halomicrobium]|uniref:Citrate (Pro-3S)-lyase n=2 Tax=Halomicrobium mukohataei TaxID=57705 RepID=C7P2A5_HALMD|nr:MULTISPECIES: CoA ester lyase [Halomicrobium]ACV49220.1 Citrate (pro-3S)-lyase [Halomicrobium mukohataei DSM 12286]QCD64625.1 CoA ester lyase [Halomicrobium mukohataei]QFR19432.1 CoA ester lyase [Halomicrobium sp. ZPS1]
MARRSVLFAPGDQPDKLRKAADSGADVAVFDLEDAVVPDRKQAAREAVRDVLATVESTCELCVRVNPIDDGAARDLSVVLSGGEPDSVMAPKVPDANAVETLAGMLAERDASGPVLALVESAAGVLHAEEIAAVDATDALLFGAEDLAGDLGATRTESGREVAHARQHALLAARAAGVDAIDTHYPAYEDEAGLREAATEARRLGYDGKMVIHPAQVPVVNAAFTPDDEAIAWARRIVEASEAADERARGVFVVDGEMIDAPQVRQAERILARAEE